MNQPDCRLLLATLKKVLKKRKMTYRDLAKKVGTTEITIKRLFTSRDTSFSRLTQICSALDLPFTQLLDMTTRQSAPTFQLSVEQEEFFAKNPDYYGFFQLLLKDAPTVETLQSEHGLPKKQVYKYLSALEKLKIIEWRPSDDIQLNVFGTLNWRERGPLQLAFMKEDCVYFIDQICFQENTPECFFTTSDRRIHMSTLAAFTAQLKNLASTFRNQAYQDEILYPKSQLVPVKWLLACARHAENRAKLVLK